jgi:uncharacterized protein YhhL (DUF1145 family)
MTASSLISIGYYFTLINILIISIDFFPLTLAIIQGLTPGVEFSARILALNELYENTYKYQNWLSIGWFVFFAVTFGAMGKIYTRIRSKLNQPTSFSPGYNVFIWLMPLVNLVRPYQALKEIYEWSGTQFRQLSTTDFSRMINVRSMWAGIIIVRIGFWLTRGAYKGEPDPQAQIKLNVFVLFMTLMQVICLAVLAELVHRIRFYLTNLDNFYASSDKDA